MKLQLLIPQYNETDDIVCNMLDSLKNQQGVDFADFEVLIGNDGSEVKLSEDLFKNYPYSIQYKQYEHTSPAGTRQRLFDEATAEYIMFCDADDMFLSALGLHTIFTYIRKGFDALVSDFIEEVKDPRTGEFRYHTHHSDNRFVHGKVYRRRHIIDNNIFWREDIKYHEDGTYNIVAIETAKVREQCKYPFYLWKWRDNSICRSDPLYVPKTYTRMIHSNSYLVKDLLDRGLFEQAKFHTGNLIYGTYYMLNKPIWLNPMNAKYRYETERCFKEYFANHRKLFQQIDPRMRATLIAGVKRRVMNEGVLLEKFTFDEWLKHIEELE